MRIAVCSDLHAEFQDHRLDIPVPDADLWIFAGDIGQGVAALHWMRRTVPAGPIVAVAGNHEFYRTGPVEDELAAMRSAAADLGISFLENETAVFEDGAGAVRVAGCTLWTDFALRGPGTEPAAMQSAAAGMNDYHLIQTETGPLRPAETAARHATSCTFLKDTLAADFPGRTVIVTHHAPLAEAGELRGRRNDSDGPDIAPAYASDLRDMVSASGVAAWIFGHTHQDWDETVGATRVVSRPGCYPAGRQFRSERQSRGMPAFEPLVIEV